MTQNDQDYSLTKTKTGKTILVIPDSHDDPLVSQERYEWLGKLIVKLRPDIVVELGDFADLNSISHYDKGTVRAENKRLERDITSAKEARRLLTAPLRQLQQAQRSSKHKVYKPRLIALAGNHEYRIQRYMEDNPTLYGMWTQDVSGAKEQGWEFYNFGEVVEVEGIKFCHFFTKRSSNKGYSGDYMTMHMVRDIQQSCIQGHSHRFEFRTFKTPFGKPVNVVVAGCYFGHHQDYAGNDNNSWWRGVLVLRNVKDGDFDLEQISYEQMETRYGQHSKHSNQNA
jgi:hypothetical protein